MTETDRLIEAGKLVQALQAGTVGLREVADRVLAKQPAASACSWWWTSGKSC